MGFEKDWSDSQFPDQLDCLDDTHIKRRAYMREAAIRIRRLVRTDADKDATIAKLREQGRIMVAAADRHFNTAMENHRECERLQEQLTERDAELAACEKDAARYRWIRDDCARAHQLDSLLLSPNPDAAIDAVRLAGQPCICGQTTVDPWCLRCTSARAAGAGDSVSLQGKETGEWKCPNCTADNTTRFVDCGRCGWRRSV